MIEVARFYHAVDDSWRTADEIFGRLKGSNSLDRDIFLEGLHSLEDQGVVESQCRTLDDGSVSGFEYRVSSDKNPNDSGRYFFPSLF